MTIYGINESQFNVVPWNGPAESLEPAIEFKILFNQTTIDLNWTSVDNATHYQVQVSLFPDFRTTFVNTVVTESDYQFTDSQTNDAKRYWRWRPSLDGGSTYFEPWSEVGSYWLNTSAVQELEMPRNTFALLDPDTTSDIYFFDLFPVYTIIDQNLFRIQQRNRLGDLLSEFLTIKGMVSFLFQPPQYIDHRQLNELQRFHNDIRTMFLATFKDGERGRPMPHIWKVEFQEDPSFTMIASGRQDLLQGFINFQEV